MKSKDYLLIINSEKSYSGIIASHDSSEDYTIISVKKQIFLAMHGCTFTIEKVFILVPIESQVFHSNGLRFGF